MARFAAAAATAALAAVSTASASQAPGRIVFASPGRPRRHTRASTHRHRRQGPAAARRKRRQRAVRTLVSRRTSHRLLPARCDPRPRGTRRDASASSVACATGPTRASPGRPTARGSPTSSTSPARPRRRTGRRRRVRSAALARQRRRPTRRRGRPTGRRSPTLASRTGRPRFCVVDIASGRVRVLLPGAAGGSRGVVARRSHDLVRQWNEHLARRRRNTFPPGASQRGPLRLVVARQHEARGHPEARRRLRARPAHGASHSRLESATTTTAPLRRLRRVAPRLAPPGRAGLQRCRRRGRERSQRAGS